MTFLSYVKKTFQMVISYQQSVVSYQLLVGKVSNLVSEALRLDCEVARTAKKSRAKNLNYRRTEWI